MELYHVTAHKNLRSILAEGLRACTYLASTDELIRYYTETVRDDGDRPVVLGIALADLDSAQLEPDYPGLEEPITSAIELDEDGVMAAWEATDGTWSDCLALIGSARYQACIRPDCIFVETADGSVSLEDYLKS